jgi:acyl-coenzyme A thioesterase PaaI-like protein
VRPITADTGEIRPRAKAVHRGGRVATAEGRITCGADGKLLAHGTSTCLILAG